MDPLNIYNNTRDQLVQLARALGTSEPWITVCIVFIFTLCMCVVYVGECKQETYTYIIFLVRFWHNRWYLNKKER